MNGSSDDSQNNDLDHRGGKTEGKDDKDDTVDNITYQSLWKEEIYSKYHVFQTSVVHKELSSNTILSSCAESLASSYLLMKEFKERFQQFKDDIGHATSMMEKALEQFFSSQRKEIGVSHYHWSVCRVNQRN